MNPVLLTTKIHMPSPRADVVNRSRLIQQLQKRASRKLILVSAPAGFGKTTFITSWLIADNHPAAWLALDKGDSDITRFLMYLFAAIQTMHPTVGQAASGMLGTMPTSSAKTILTPLLNDLATIQQDFYLILDDYHLIDSSAVDDALTFLLEHLPPRVHLIISTREDPRLPLARLRAKGQLSEIRASDLRFTADEASAFLNSAMGLNLSAQDVTALGQRTEGWIAGLQLLYCGIAV